MQEHSHLFHLSSNRNWVAAVFSIQGRSYGVRIWSTKWSGTNLSFSDMHIKTRRKTPYLHPMHFPYGVFHIVNGNKCTKSKNIINWITAKLFLLWTSKSFFYNPFTPSKGGGGGKNKKNVSFLEYFKRKKIYMLKYFVVYFLSFSLITNQNTIC